MRLINTQTRELEEYIGSNTPQYVALSHRWTSDEISYKDYVKGRGQTSVGYKKILEFCEVAQSRGYQYVWIDTACIDKRSSSELSEAINSMYRWYQEAEECYAHLSDVREADDESFEQFRSSVWWTRGWTLQELLAPRMVRFFTATWSEIGFCADTVFHRSKRNLNRIVAEITSISPEIFEYTIDLSKFSVAERMTWLQGRETTRTEDLAYCALGIFGVNMPLLYGEGRRSWDRLVEEIVRTTHDESIFLWYKAPAELNFHCYVEILPAHPNLFALADCRDSPVVDKVVERPAYSITNQGLELRLKAKTARSIAYGKCTKRSMGSRQSRRNNLKVVLVPLNCVRSNSLRLPENFPWPEPDTIEDNGIYFLVLVEKLCGHFDRLLVPRSTIRQLIRDSCLLQHDKTLSVHANQEAQNRCRRYERQYEAEEGIDFNLAAITGERDVEQKWHRVEPKWPIFSNRSVQRMRLQSKLNQEENGVQEEEEEEQEQDEEEEEEEGHLTRRITQGLRRMRLKLKFTQDENGVKEEE